MPRYLFLVFFASFVGAAFGQDPATESPPLPQADFHAPSIRFERLSLEEGLSQSSVEDVAQDANGYIWFATKGGLNRFDGYDVEVYKPVPFDSSSLSSNWINAIHVDNSNRLWAATFGGGLNVREPTTGRFVQFRHDPEDSTTLSSDYLSAVTVGNGEEVWVGTRGDGLNRLDVASGRAERFAHDPDDPSSLSGNWVRAIFEDRGGRIWVSTDNGVDRIDPESGAVTRMPALRDGSGRFTEDAQNPNVLWIGSANGLVRYDTATDRHERFVPPGDAEGRQVVRNAVQDPADRDILWLATHGGVYRFNKRTHTFHGYHYDARDPHSLADDYVTRVYADRSGVIWAATYDGLSSFATTGTGFTTYEHREDDPNSILSDGVWSVYEDREGILWVGSARGLDAVHRPSGRIRHFERDSTGGSGPRGSVYVIMEDRADTFWLGTSGGLAMLDRDAGSFRHFRHDPNDSTSLANNVVGAIHEDRQGRFWVGTLGGFHRMNRRTQQFRRYEHDPGDAATICGRNPIAIEEDHQGRIWIGTIDGGFCRLNDDLETFIRFQHDPADLNSLSHNYVMAIQETRREPGVFWIATYGGGLNRFDSRDGTFRHFADDAGLSNDLYAVLEDENGLLWITSNSGLYQFDPSTETVRHFDVDDGLPSNEFSQWAYHRSGSGEMFFGGIKGVTAFFPTEIRSNEIPPRTSFTGLKLENRSIRPGSGPVLPRPIGEMDEVRIPPGHRTVSIDYIGLHYKNSKDNRYQYRLVGFDREWVDAGTGRSATYTNLDPGSYVLEVKAANSDGVWTPEPIRLGVTMLPPWWRTTWAYVLYGLVFFGGVFAVDRVQRRRVIRREREKAETRELEQARALKKAYTQLEQSQAIVRAINAETGLESLLNAVLEQARVIPGVEKASAIVYDDDLDAYVVKASEGWDSWQVKELRMTEEQAAARYTDHAEEVVDDVFLEREVSARPTFAGMEELEEPASMLVLRIRSGERTDGYIVFDNMHDRDAFQDRDVDLLVNLREHVRSAFLKARLVDNLQRSLAHLRATQDQLVQQEKLASLGALTAGIAHEIKNPLNFVNNFAGLSQDLIADINAAVETLNGHVSTDMVQEIRELLEDLRTNAAKIEEHGRRADGIVHSMLLHSKGSTGERRSTDVNALVDEYVGLAYHGRRAQVPDFACRIAKDFDVSVGHANFAPQDIGRVLVNLLQNAFDAVHEKALASGDAYAPQVGVSTSREAGTVVIRVEDNGPGIQVEKQESIFEPFFTTKPTGKGTGLGLSISYEIVTRGHGGRLTVETAEGGGAAFAVHLPA